MSVDDVVGDYDLITSKPLASITLQDLEQVAYNAALSAGEAEYIMFRTLADIRETELWKQSGEATFGDYMSEWVQELHSRAASRGQTTPYSIRHVQKVLALHRRLVSHLELDDKKVLTANPDVLDRMCRALGTWDYKTGALKEVSPAARKWLDVEWPDEPLEDQVRNTAEVVMGMARKGEALEYLRRINPDSGGQFIEFVVQLSSGYPLVTAKVSDPEGEVWYQKFTEWPEFLIHEMTHRLGSSDPVWKEANE